MAIKHTLAELGIQADHEIYHNPGPARLYELALQEGSAIAASGALISMSGACTGRTPSAKRIVRESPMDKDVWWGPVNIEAQAAEFQGGRERAASALGHQPRLYVIDGYVGWDPEWQLKVRLVCARAYHALFMYNMMLRPTAEQLATFGEPDWLILNAGQSKAETDDGTDIRVMLEFSRQEFVILGTEYAGEMKKGLFTVLNYLLPTKGDFPMHCSANAGPSGATALFFGLSGTGKTTLSAAPGRTLIGDDEHGWTDRGIFNFEGGCYAKAIGLSPDGEPYIWHAIRFGAILENVVFDPDTRAVDYTDDSITENTRCSYPVEFVDAKLPCTGGHPKQILFLTCDAHGVLPPVAKLTPSQAMYHFISGYTAKVAGTETGVKEPKATFSACFGEPFLVWHPTVYARLLKKKIAEHQAEVWLINTGWTGGPYGIGERISLARTRAIISAILDGRLASIRTEQEPMFGLHVPIECPGVPDQMLRPELTWANKAAYEQRAIELARHFHANFQQYASEASKDTLDAAPLAGRTPVAPA